jgi:hypothetical protein
LPDSANVFNDVIRRLEKEPMAKEIAPREPATDEASGMRLLWRLAAWGGGAALALFVVAIASQTQTGSQRLALALAPVELPVRPVATVRVPPPEKPKDAETERLAAELRVLSADRDRLAARVSTLERQLDDMTGSIKRLAARPAPAPAPKERPAPSMPATVSPLISPLAMPKLGGPASWTRPASPTSAKAQAPETAEADAAEPEAAEPDASKAAPAPTEPQMEDAAPAEPQTKDAAAPALDKVPLPPVRIAAAEPGKPQFGLALAGASSLELTRIQWTMLKANFEALLAGLEPRAVAEKRGKATHYQLLAGPLPSFTEATKLCARLIAAHASCRPVKFAGDPL